MHALQPHPIVPRRSCHPMAVSTGPLAPVAHGTARVKAPQTVGAADRAAEQWVWHSRFGTIVIEVRGKDVFVNGDRVAPHAP